jgi:hypothetical protein
MSAEGANDLFFDILSRFDEGAAIVRATAIGREQWTRLPPPVIREVPITIQH